MPIKHDDERVLRPNLKRELTQEQLFEIAKCQLDVKYFASHYYKVISDAGEHIIQLRDFQKRLLDHFVHNRFKITMSGRQSGKCLESQQCVEILDTSSGKIEKMKIGDFFNKIKNEK
jgi:hypothetical protein